MSKRAGFPYSDLPHDLRKIILWHLDLPSLIICQRVCKEWCQLINDPLLWKDLTLRGMNTWLGFEHPRIASSFRLNNINNNNNNNNNSAQNETMSPPTVQRTKSLSQYFGNFFGFSSNPSSPSHNDKVQKTTAKEDPVSKASQSPKYQATTSPSPLPSSSSSPFPPPIPNNEHDSGVLSTKAKAQSNTSKTPKSEQEKLQIPTPPSDFQLVLPDSSVSWKSFFLRQHLLNRNSLKNSSSPHVSDTSEKKKQMQSPSLVSAKIASTIPILALFGEGLQTSAKKLIYRLMWDDISPMQLTQMFPGTESGLGSGVGFDLGNNLGAFNCVALHRYEERGFLNGVEGWQRFLGTVNGLVYVVDMHKDWEIARQELFTFLKGVNPAPPLAILACYKGEVVDFNPLKVAHHLCLNDSMFAERIYYIRFVNLTDLEGIYDAFAWVAKNIVKRPKE